MKPVTLVDGRFELQRQAGSGAMGVVHRALDRATGDTVALKVLRVPDPASWHRLEREAMLLLEQKHSGIVRYVAHGTTEEGRPYLAMEWLEGETLAMRLERSGLTIDESVRLARRIAVALASLHRVRVVHRDIKPANLFLVDRDLDQVKVLDFGRG